MVCVLHSCLHFFLLCVYMWRRHTTLVFVMNIVNTRSTYSAISSDFAGPCRVMRGGHTWGSFWRQICLYTVKTEPFPPERKTRVVCYIWRTLKRLRARQLSMNTKERSQHRLGRGQSHPSGGGGRPQRDWGGSSHPMTETIFELRQGLWSLPPIYDHLLSRDGGPVLTYVSPRTNMNL